MNGRFKRPAVDPDSFPRFDPELTHDEVTPSLTADPGPQVHAQRHEALDAAVRARSRDMDETPQDIAKRAEVFAAFLSGEVEQYSQAEEQIKVLAEFITNEIPGEPSQSGGAVKTAIRLLRDAYIHPDVASEVLTSSDSVAISSSDDEREVDYRISSGSHEIEVVARGYNPVEAAAAIRMLLDEEEEA